MSFNEEFILKQFKNLIDIDSTTGDYKSITNYIIELSKKLGFNYQVCHKGGVIVELGGKGNDLVITAHLDDIGLMVRKINNDGTLNVCPVGGLYPFYCVGENVTIKTFLNKVYTGVVCRCPSSVHVTENEIRGEHGDFRKNVCVVLDEDVKCIEDVKKLGIDVGDYIGLDPRFKYVNGYIKSRFIDDKACVTLMLNLMKDVYENKLSLNRKVLLYFATFEEIGHGTVYLPDGVKDIIAIDIAPTGPDQQSDEKKVSIFAKDSRFPYNIELISELRQVALDANVNYCMDIFTPHYGSDADGSVLAGYDIRHAAIGPGTSNSHGYERTHIDGLNQTYNLLVEYLKKS